MLEILVIALILDAILGEPDWLWTRVPHPAVLMGRLVSALERYLNTGTQRARKRKGLCALLIMIGVGITVGLGLSLMGSVIETILVAILLAQKSLVSHVQAVATGLSHSLDQGRFALSMIVSRDTAQMTQSQVARSAIESGAENLSDGVIAPAFWYLLLGLPGIITYKIINTADSMIGYKTERYLAFGWAAARCDDLVNLIPARLTAALIILTNAQWSDLHSIRAEANNHKSPNAGWPEAAMARAIGISLAGPRSYDGHPQHFPWIHPNGRKRPDAHDINRACDVLWQAWSLFLFGTVLLAMT